MLHNYFYNYLYFKIHFSALDQPIRWIEGGNFNKFTCILVSSSNITLYISFFLFYGL